MKKYKILESVSVDGNYYEAGQEVELSPEMVAKIAPFCIQEIAEPTTKTTK